MAIDKSSEAYREYMKLAHRADQRLLRLERLEKEPYFAGVKEYSYKGAQRNIRELGGEGGRFRSVKITSEEDLQKATASVQDFLSRPTSTKRDIIRIYKKRVASFNKTKRKEFSDWQDLTWQEFADAWEMIENDKEGKKGYSSVTKAFSNMKKEKPETILEEFATKAGKDAVIKRLTSDKAEAEILRKIGSKIIKVLI